MDRATIEATSRMWAKVAEMIQIAVEVEAMKALNAQRAEQGHSQAYGEDDFWEKSQALGCLSVRFLDEC